MTFSAIAEAKQITCALLAFKPQHFQSAVEDLRGALAKDALIISIMAGISTQTIGRALGDVRVVRVMPNTSTSAGGGMSGVAAGEGATDADVARAEAICSASGAVLQVSEAQMDAVTAISGSGPAYFFRFCEALMAAVSRCGFSEDEARLLVFRPLKVRWPTPAQEGFPSRASESRSRAQAEPHRPRSKLSLRGSSRSWPPEEIVLQRGKELNADVG